jgi:lipopolysaccharide export system permease protein
VRARTLFLYVLREVLLFGGLALAALVPLLVSRNLFQVLDAGIVGQLEAADLGFLAGSIAVMLAPYALPIAFLLGALLAVGRMAGDREALALRACGVGLRQVLLPVVALGVLVSAVTGYLMLEVEHRAQRELRERVRALALRGGLLGPGAPRRLGALTLFARERWPDGELGGVVLRDESDPERPLLVVAERGRLELDREAGALELRLVRGDVHLGRGAGQRIAFDSLEYAIPDERLWAAQRARVRPREMTLAELQQVLERARAGDPLDGYREQNPVEYSLQIHRRFALPVAPALFGLVAVPLGLRVRRNARVRAALGCGVLVGGYYILLMFGQFLALDGALPAVAAAWLPNGAFGLAAAGLLRAAGRPGA